MRICLRNVEFLGKTSRTRVQEVTRTKLDIVCNIKSWISYLNLGLLKR
jgi:hypothetical protein